MWDHFKDLSGVQPARVLHEDVQLLSRYGMSGFISCQVQRAAFPTGLSMAAMASSLWDRDGSFEQMAADYMARNYGVYGARVMGLVEDVSRVLDAPALRAKKIVVGRLARLRALQLDACVQAIGGAPELKSFVRVVDQLCGVLDLHAAGDAPRMNAAWDALLAHLAENRDSLAGGLERVRHLSEIV